MEAITNQKRAAVGFEALKMESFAKVEYKRPDMNALKKR